MQANQAAKIQNISIHPNFQKRVQAAKKKRSGGPYKPKKEKDSKNFTPLTK